MPYVGNIPAESYAAFNVQHFTTSATTSYTLDHAVTNELDIRLVINNVIQQPGSGKAYTASGTTLTLSAATSGTDTMYCVYTGKAVQTVVPPAGSVTGSTLADDVISGQSALGAEPADTDEFLVSDAGVLKRVDYSYIKRLSNWSESSGNLLPSNASYGIYLGVNSATAANLLDDYEEGVWTPALSNFGGSSESFIDPRYTKVGRLVTVSCQLQIGSFPSDGSTVAISGLPFTVKSGSGTTFGTVPFRQTNTTIMGLTIGDNNTVMEMYEVGNGGGQFNYNDFGQSKQMAFVAQYETA